MYNIQLYIRKWGSDVGALQGGEGGSRDGARRGEWARCCYFWLLSKAAKTFFPNTWHRPLILWVWGRMKASEGGRKEAGEINGEKTLLGVVWICFTPRCLDCFLFLHTAATKLRIPIGRHGNARQQRRNKHFLTGLHGKKCSGARCNRRQWWQRRSTCLRHRTPGSPLLRLLG